MQINLTKGLNNYSLNKKINTDKTKNNKTFGNDNLSETKSEPNKKRNNIIISSVIASAIIVGAAAFLGSSAYMHKNKWKDIDLTKDDIAKDTNFFKKIMIKTGDWLNNLFNKTNKSSK